MRKAAGTKTFTLDAVHHAGLDSPVSRKTLLKYIPAILLAPAASTIALASGDSADASSRESRRLRIDQRFLLFPINSESLSRRVRLVKNRRMLRSFTASLGLPAQWWAHVDVSAWRGQALSLSLEPDNSPPTWLGTVLGRGASESDAAELVAAIRTSDEIWSAETLYKRTSATRVSLHTQAWMDQRYDEFKKLEPQAIPLTGENWL